MHGDLTAMAYLTEVPDRPLMAILGGGKLASKLKLVDALIDLVDTLVVGGALGVTFLASMHTDDAGVGGTRSRPKRWGQGRVGPWREPAYVLAGARKLLTKARRRGVQVRH